tara:strand:- start:45 stop:671 length:627 start_codon:yes stop_codon:yes gene_type:complete
MPRKATDYSRTIIYKIQHQDKEDLLYIGSTTDFTKRKSQHKRTSSLSTYRDYNEKKYKMIRDNGGWDCFRMLEIKKFPCNDANEAHAEEDRIMQELKATMNDRRASRTERQYYLDNEDFFREKQRKYYEGNKEKVLNYSKEYRNKNNIEIKEYSKIYREENREKLKQKCKERYNKNREVVICECGCSIVKHSLNSHLKTKKHLDLISS